jgi:hypothetical protein
MATIKDPSGTIIGEVAIVPYPFTPLPSMATFSPRTMLTPAPAAKILGQTLASAAI